MFILMISRPSSNMGHAEFKTRPKLKENLVNTLEAEFFYFGRLKLCQNVCINDI